jgi:hypothetical protein
MAVQSIKGLVDPKDIAALAIFLSSDAAKSISRPDASRRQRHAGRVLNNSRREKMHRRGSVLRRRPQDVAREANRGGNRMHRIDLQNYSSGLQRRVRRLDSDPRLQTPR